jgi:protease IV
MPASPIYPDDASRPPAPTVIVQTHSGGWRSWALRLAVVALGCSLLANLSMFAAYRDYFAKTDAPLERYHSGDKFASDKIAVLTMKGTISYPFTERLIKQIKHAAETDSIKGVLLVVDSPGGFVADSHQIYHELQKLVKKKPVYVQMKRIAASGGYYIAMGAGTEGRIFAEPTTWTGSIGVIIPRYDLTKLAEKFGVDSDPLKTGEFKDALSPFRPLSDSERALWENILDQSYQMFVGVIAENRENLDKDQVKALATGQIYTASDAVENGLVDEIGFEEDALETLKTKLNLSKVRVVSFEHQATLMDLVLGTAKAEPTHPWRTLLEASVPQGLYYCSWLPPLPE